MMVVGSCRMRGFGGQCRGDSDFYRLPGSGYHDSCGGAGSRLPVFSGGAETGMVGAQLNWSQQHCNYPHQHQREAEGMFDAVRQYPITRRSPHHHH